MSFLCFPGKIWFEPIKKDSIIANDKDTVVEAGKVLGVGEGVTFVKEGDMVFFLSYGAEQTPEVEGKSYWTVLCDERFIMGKIEHV